MFEILVDNYKYKVLPTEKVGYNDTLNLQTMRMKILSLLHQSIFYNTHTISSTWVHFQLNLNIKSLHSLNLKIYQDKLSR